LSLWLFRRRPCVHICSSFYDVFAWRHMEMTTSLSFVNEYSKKTDYLTRIVNNSIKKKICSKGQPKMTSHIFWNFGPLCHEYVYLRQKIFDSLPYIVNHQYLVTRFKQYLKQIEINFKHDRKVMANLGPWNFQIEM